MYSLVRRKFAGWNPALRNGSPPAACVTALFPQFRLAGGCGRPLSDLTVISRAGAVQAGREREPAGEAACPELKQKLRLRLYAEEE